MHAALAGAASGSRSLTGLAALILATPGDAKRQPDRTLGRPWVKCRRRAGGDGGDLGGQAAHRAQPPEPARSGQQAGRSSRRRGDHRPPGTPEDDSPAQLAGCVAASVGAAVATAWLGTRWRAWAASRFGHDWIGAVMEDATAVTLATAAARPASV